MVAEVFLRTNFTERSRRVTGRALGAAIEGNTRARLRLCEEENEREARRQEVYALLSCTGVRAR
eukprot:7827755-Pyramimonas_sp.AAC.2